MASGSETRSLVALAITLLLLADLFSPLSFAEKSLYGAKEQAQKVVSALGTQGLIRSITPIQSVPNAPPQNGANALRVIPGKPNPITKTPLHLPPMSIVPLCQLQGNCPPPTRQEVRKPTPSATMECIMSTDCGDDGFIGQTFTFEGKTYQKFRKYYCMDANTQISHCRYKDQNIQIITMAGNGTKRVSAKPKVGYGGADESVAFFSSQQTPLLEWGPETQVTNNSAGFTYNNSLYPKVAVSSDGNPFVVWESTIYPSDHPFIANEIYFQKSIDQGSTWMRPIKISSSGRATIPAIAASGNLIHVVWKEEINASSKFMYVKSFDGGTTWSQPKVILTTDDLGVSDPAVAANQSDIYLVWSEYRKMKNGAMAVRVYLKKSSDAGQNWLPETQVLNGDASDPAISVSGQNVYLAWESDGMYYQRSIDKGNTWSSEQRISGDNAKPGRPVMTTDLQGGIFVVWADNSNSHNGIYLNKSLDNGDKWGEETKLSSGELNGYDETPAIAANSLGVYALWTQHSSGTSSGLATDIFYSKSNDRGTIWSQAVPLTNSNDKSYPGIAANDLTVHVVWQIGDSASSVNQVFHRVFFPKSCTKKDDCGTSGFFGDKVCQDSAITQAYRQYSCLNGLCYNSDETRTLQSCSNGCLDSAQCACKAAYTCIDSKKLGYLNPNCTISPIRTCEASCTNNACTCNDSFRCAGNDILHTKTDCTSEYILCEAWCSNNACQCNEKDYCQDNTHSIHKDKSCGTISTTCETGCDQGTGKCNEVCATGWFCPNEHYKAYREKTCAYTNLAQCPDGCVNGECIIKPHCAPDWACVDNRTAGYRNEDCTWDYKEACRSNEICRNGYCFDDSSQPTCSAGSICEDSYRSAYRNQNCTLTNEQYCPDGCLDGTCISTPKCGIPDGSSRSCSCYSDNECPSSYACQSKLGFNACVPKPNNPAQSVNRLGSEGYCAPERPCNSGEGDCDTDNDCNQSLTCSQNIGNKHGFASEVDVCEQRASQGDAKEVNLDDYYSQAGIAAVAAPYMISRNGFRILPRFDNDSLRGAWCVLPEIREQNVPHFNLTIYKDPYSKKDIVYNLHLMNVKNKDGKVCPYVWESVSDFCHDFCGRSDDDLIRNPPPPYPPGILSSDIAQIIKDYKLGISEASVLPIVEWGSLAGLGTILVITLYLAQKAVRCTPVPGNITLLSCPFPP